MRKLKSSEIKDFREKTLNEQGNKCALSGIELSKERAVVDHSHKSGLIRAVIDRGVNSFLGKLENGMTINRISIGMLKTICENLISYLGNESEILHPSHKTPEEKKALQKKRRQRKKKNE